MNRTFRSENIRDTYGDGLSDVFKSMFNSATKKLASESTKEIATSVVESAVKSAAEPLGKKTGEVLANKIFNSSDKDKKIEPIIEQPNEVIPDKGYIIEKDLKKIYKTDIDKNDTISNISKKFDELL